MQDWNFRCVLHLGQSEYNFLLFVDGKTKKASNIDSL